MAFPFLQGSSFFFFFFFRESWKKEPAAPRTIENTRYDYNSEGTEFLTPFSIRTCVCDIRVFHDRASNALA